MISGIILLVGGVAFFLTGLGVDVPVLGLLGGIWALGGFFNVVGSRLARTAAANEALATGAPEAAAATSATAPDPLNPLVLARRRQTVRGTGSRGLVALISAALAIAVGVAGGIPWAEGAFAVPTLTDVFGSPIMQIWRIPTIMAGAILGILALIGLVANAASATDRAATHEATVTLVSYRDRGLRNSTGRPYIEAVFDVHAADLPRYQATISTVIPMLAVAKLFEGNQFPALVAGPDKPSAVIVDWNAGATPGTTPPTTTASAAVPPLAVTVAEPADRLRELDALRTQGLVTAEEYSAQRARILDSL